MKQQLGRREKKEGVVVSEQLAEEVNWAAVQGRTMSERGDGGALVDGWVICSCFRFFFRFLPLFLLLFQFLFFF